MIMLWIWWILHALAAVGLAGYGLAKKELMPDLKIYIFWNAVMAVVVALFLLAPKWHRRVLVGLNLVVGVALVILAGTVINDRQNFAKRLDELERIKTGQSVDQLSASLNPEQKAALVRVREPRDQRTPPGPDGQIKSPERSEFEARNEIVQALAEQIDVNRKKMDEIRKQLSLTEETKDKRNLVGEFGKLVDQNQQLVSELGVQYAGKTGAAAYRRYVEEQIQLGRFNLPFEARNLADRLQSLKLIRAELERDFQKLEVETAKLNEQLETEKKVTQQQTEQVAGRQKELVELNAEVEEALHAREISQGRARDMRLLLERTRAAYQQMTRENQELDLALAYLELGWSAFFR